MPIPTWHTSDDFDLSSFPAIRAWLERIAAEPGHVAMQVQPVDAAVAK